MNKEILTMIKQSEELCFILNLIESLNLKQGCLCAGSIRNYIWDQLYNTKHEATDIDIIFYDPLISYSEVIELQDKLNSLYPKFDFEIRNQVHMHTHNPNTEAYKDIEDALAHFPERCTAIAIYKQNNDYKLIAPYGVEDLFNGIVQATPYFDSNSLNRNTFIERLKEKQWKFKWPKLTIIE